MLRLAICRHGQSEGDTLELIEGSADLPLTATGRLQGALLAERLETAYRPAAVFSSPLARARDIADDDPAAVEAAVSTWRKAGEAGR